MLIQPQKHNLLVPGRTLYITFILLALAAILLYYGVFIEPQQIRIRSVVIHNRTLARVLPAQKALLLSDFHLGSTTPAHMNTLLRTIKKIAPDIIFLTGDYVAWSGDAKVYTNAIGFLEKLKAPLGTYGVLGESDYRLSRQSCQFCHLPGNEYSQPKAPPLFLDNAMVRIETGNGVLNIFGLDRLTDKIDHTVTRLKTLPREAPIIVLSHSSEISRHIDSQRLMLILSGDTHGGQIRLPALFWKIFRYKPNPEHIYGLYRDGRKTIYVTSGIGTSFPHFRIGVPPEIVVLEFRP